MVGNENGEQVMPEKHALNNVMTEAGTCLVVEVMRRLGETELMVNEVQT